MKKMLHFLTRPWVLLFLGVFALSLLIWFLGHWLWLTSKASKIIAILSLCLIVVLYQAYQLRKKNRVAEQLLNSLTTVPIDDVTEQLHQDVENLSKSLIETLQILKKTYKGSRHSDYRYELPWYMLIGASGSGKTTALENSGLNFPLDKAPAHSLESTKNCDFWLTDHAVILDMAGRYTTQDSHKTVDSGAWLHFLELLKKARPRRPINGVLITLRFSDLLLSETERKKQVTAIRQRIDELHQQFGVRFPVYMIFTKSDLIAGFNEFFSDLERQDIQQVWGFTFTVNHQALSEAMFEQINQHFEELLKVLRVRMLKRLQDELDIERRALIFGFPQRLMLLRDNLQEFLNDCYGGNRYQTTAYLRGVYWTSATQEGTPTDPLMNVMADSFQLDNKSLPPFSGKRKSFFFTHLLKEVIFQETQLVSLNPKIERRERWLRYAVLGGTLSVVFTMSALWCISVQKNQQALTQVNNLIHEYNNPKKYLDESNFDGILERLNKIQNMRIVFQSQSSLWMHFGLYQGERVQNKLDTAYQTLLLKQFLPRINQRLSLHIKEQFALQCDKDNLLYAWLETYLMLHKEQSNHFNQITLSKMMAEDWKGLYSSDVQKQMDLQKHLKVLLAFKPVLVDEASSLVTDARYILNERCSHEQQIYMRLISHAKELAKPDLKIFDAFGVVNAEKALATKTGSLATLSVPYLYTHEGFYHYFVKEVPRAVDAFSEGDWVRGSHADTAKADFESLKRGVYGEYYKDYVKHWKALLNTVNLKQTHSSQEQQTLLSTLQSAVSPLPALATVVKKETTLSVPPSITVYDPKKEAQAAVLSRLGNYIPQAVIEANTKRQAQKNLPYAIETVEKEFRDFSLNEESITSLKKLYNCSVSNDSNRSNLITICKEEAIRLKNSAKLLPEPLKSILDLVSTKSKSEIESGEKESLNDQWKQEIVPLYKTLQNAYPFNRNRSAMVLPSDLTLFFTKLDAFINSHSNSTISLEQAKTVKGNLQRMFFANGTQQPNLHFTLQLLSLSPLFTVKKLKITIGGQSTEFSNVGTLAAQFQWSPNTDVKFAFETTSPLPEQSFSGTWSLLKMVDKMGVPSHNGMKFFLVFINNEAKAIFELTPDSRTNPFSRNIKFTLPANL